MWIENGFSVAIRASHSLAYLSQDLLSVFRWSKSLSGGSPGPVFGHFGGNPQCVNAVLQNKVWKTGSETIGAQMWIGNGFSLPIWASYSLDCLDWHLSCFFRCSENLGRGSLWPLLGVRWHWLCSTSQKCLENVSWNMQSVNIILKCLKLANFHLQFVRQPGISWILLRIIHRKCGGYHKNLHLLDFLKEFLKE